MKRTPFYNIHRRLGAKVVEFAGFEMPLQYSSIIEEHLCVRNHVGVFDVSHMGEIEISGSEAAEFLQRMTVNDISKLFDGRVQYSAMLYDDGGIVDDLLVYEFSDHFMLVVNAANKDKDFAWLQSHAQGDVHVKDSSDEVALLAVQGPKSLATLERISSVDLSALKYYHFLKGTIAGVEATISRTGYTGELGFEIYFEADSTAAEKVWNAVMDAGSEFVISPAGLGARDTLRLEMGYCLYGNDIDATTNPLEAGLDWITKMGKGDFVGRDALVRIQQSGIRRKLIGFVIDDPERGKRAFPRHGYDIVMAEAPHEKLGHVTSGTFSPVLQRGIGMGYVRKEFAEPGTIIAVDIRGNPVRARVVHLPFVDRKPF
ncbi:MAG: glycine cleavage system aminomethyltransferase GcvT [Bacteroidota bacterium]